MTADEVEPLALLVAHLGIAQQLLAEHVADSTGQSCVRCSGQVRQIAHPCPLRFYALQALALDEGPS